jgi:hypothetical protein
MLFNIEELWRKLSMIKEVPELEWIGDASRHECFIPAGPYVKKAIRVWIRRYAAKNVSVGLLYDEKNHRKYLRAVEVYMHLIQTLMRKEASRMDIVIVFDEEPKRFPAPGELMNEEHINSGYTEFAGTWRKIKVIRRQEWDRVLAHEMLHACDVDVVRLEEEERKIEKRYGVERVNKRIELRVTEAYVEMLACVLRAWKRGYRTMEDLERYHEEERALLTKLAYQYLAHNDWKLKQGNTHTFAYVWCKAAIMNKPKVFETLTIEAKESYEYLKEALDEFKILEHWKLPRRGQLIWMSLP